ncbi:PDDEXK nuclease domain-containing protein [Roseomonas sp. GC11]|uniref:PDDEXK nuclease domain-containing protein n=1 Tax=Roseomonas sp. GC11 TaxID=2950546 RepID=UPI00210B237E|nr:PDDEXK nuclease domain-containing protein [Roseomonas sp. GC11]MCQ4159499.1 PDDEXK nuclease domain-containing protein [Roseomonas sp. GC11]
MSLPTSRLPEGYGDWLAALKSEIREARLRTALAVNSELIGLYWRIGREILERQERHGWGARVVDRLSTDLRAEFPGMQGFSRANLLYMRAFAEAWPEPGLVQRVVGRLPWGQNIELLTKLKDPADRLWYAEATLEHGWSRAVLATQIQTRLRERQGHAVTNFSRALPPGASDLAQQILKDPYQFDFLALPPEVRERELERALVGRVKDLLLEMGKGFAFIGSQHKLDIGGQDWFVDLLFYHRRLRCLVAVDLKIGAFQPEHAGKMNFYLTALDEREREPGDNPSIGLILCRERNRVVVEYTLRSVNSPIGVAEYRLLLPEALPAALAEALPTPEELLPGMDLPE